MFLTLIFGRQSKQNKKKVVNWSLKYTNPLIWKGQQPTTSTNGIRTIGCSYFASSAIKLSATGRPVVWLSGLIQQDGISAHCKALRIAHSGPPRAVAIKKKMTSRVITGQGCMTGRFTNLVLMLGHRLRRWPNIKPTLLQRLLFGAVWQSLAVRGKPRWTVRWMGTSRLRQTLKTQKNIYKTWRPKGYF